MTVKWSYTNAQLAGFGKFATSYGTASGTAPVPDNGSLSGPRRRQVRCMTVPDFVKKRAFHKKSNALTHWLGPALLLWNWKSSVAFVVKPIVTTSELSITT